MDLLDFSREAYKSADHYYKYLSETEQGVDTILVTKIIDIDNFKFRLLTSKKIFNLDQTYIVINSVLFPFDISKVIKILDSSTEPASVTIRVAPESYDAMKNLNPADVKIISDLKFLVKAVKDWYHKFHDKLTTPESDVERTVSLENLDLSEASDNQKMAIKTALESSISYIWGAPGTGKTQFVLANCIMNYVKSHKKIILMAPTNNALEQSARGVLKILQKNGIPTNTLLRLGRASSEFTQEYPEVCESTNLDQTLNQLKKEIETLTQEVQFQNEYLLFISKKSELEQAISSFNSSLKISNDLLVEKSKKNDLKSSFEDKISVLKNRLKICKYEISVLQKDRSKFFNRIKYILSDKKNYESLKAIDEKQKIIDALLSDIAKNIELLNQCTSAILAIEESHKRECSNTSRMFSQIKEISRLLFNQEYDVDELMKKVNEKLNQYSNFSVNPDLELTIREKQTELMRLASAQAAKFENKYIIACTVDYAVLRFEDFPQAIDKDACHVFVDEAAYCPMIKAGVFFAYNLPVTFLGDHMQLPPICEMDENVIKASHHNIFLWSQSSLYFPEIFLDNSDFESMYKRYHDNEDIETENIQVAFLNNTYRFGDNLAKILDKFVYHSGFSGLAFENVNISVIDAPHNAKESLPRTSTAEANAIYEYILKNNSDLGDFAILTPYKNQLKLLNKKFASTRVDISTIHASQGREWDTVFISVVDAHNKFFTDSTSKKSNGLKIINTAISRAKKRLILVLDYEHWELFNDEQLLASVATQHTNILQV